MSEESEKDKAVAALIRNKVWDYAGKLLSHDAVSDTQQEMAVGELADLFTKFHQQLVESRKKLGTAEGEEEMRQLKERLIERVVETLGEKAPESWRAAVKRKPDMEFLEALYRLNDSRRDNKRER